MLLEATVFFSAFDTDRAGIHATFIIRSGDWIAVLIVGIAKLIIE